MVQWCPLSSAVRPLLRFTSSRIWVFSKSFLRFRCTRIRHFSLRRKTSSPRNTRRSMEEETLLSLGRKKATSRVCVVSSLSTELLEMHSEEPSVHILFIPGNPGIVSFYKDFIEAAYELLQGNASITAIGHISHSGKDREHGKMFSLQEQINHKVDFIKQELHHNEMPFILSLLGAITNSADWSNGLPKLSGKYIQRVLVSAGLKIGHSIGSYMCLEIFKRLPQQVKYAIGLYPFLTLNRDSLKQTMIGMVARSSILSATISSFVSLLGSFPTWTSRALMRGFLGQSWSATAVDAACTHLMQYHTVRNILFMAMTEFIQLSKEPDWIFMREKQNQIALLFGIDDHWGPLSLSEEVSKQVPGLVLSIEREGHTHAFCCTKAGSTWVAHHVANLIRGQIPK